MCACSFHSDYYGGIRKKGEGEVREVKEGKGEGATRVVRDDIRREEVRERREKEEGNKEGKVER